MSLVSATSGNASMSGCLCTGICKSLGYCPNATNLGLGGVGWPTVTLGYCNCPCHKIHFSVDPPVCICNCPKPTPANIKDYASILGMKNMPDRLDKLESTCRKLEQEMSNQIQYMADANMKHEKLRSESRTFYVERFKELEKKVEKLIKDFEEKMSNSNLNGQKRPFKCPVCSGNGVLYSDTVLSQHMLLAGWKSDAEGRPYKPCHACEGKGIVWG